MKCKMKTEKICCKICEHMTKILERIGEKFRPKEKLGPKGEPRPKESSRPAKKSRKNKRKNEKKLGKKGFVFSLDAFFAVIIATSLIGATFFLLSQAQQDYLRELQMAQIANDVLLVIDEKGILESHNKSDIKHALMENLPTNFGARLRVFPYECSDSKCTGFVSSTEVPPYEVLKGYQKPVDAMLVMDTSSSMSDDPPHQNCYSFWCFISGQWGCTWCTGGITDSKEAAISFLDFLYFEKDRSGLATFGTTAELEQGLTSDKSAISSEINDIDVPCRCDIIQRTAMGDGIDIANQEFETNGRPNAEWVQIVLSDGKSNTGQDPLDAAQDAADDNITIYTIGLGNDADPDTLQQIADITNGKYYYAPTGDQLESIYAEIAREIFKISKEVVSVKRSFLTFENNRVKYYSIAEMGVWLI